MYKVKPMIDETNECLHQSMTEKHAILCQYKLLDFLQNNMVTYTRQIASEY